MSNAAGISDVSPTRIGRRYATSDLRIQPTEPRGTGARSRSRGVHAAKSPVINHVTDIGLKMGSDS